MKKARKTDRSPNITSGHRGRTVFRGRPVSPGFGAGTAFFYRVGDANMPDIRRVAVSEAVSELDRLEEALRRSRHELEVVQERVLCEIGEEESRIMGVHLGLLQDQTFVEKLRKHVLTDRFSAESAVIHETKIMDDMLRGVENEYFRERVLDVHDIRVRLLRQLGHGGASRLKRLPPDTVVVARELLPSDTLNMDRANVSALLLERGGPTSHAAILARSMGIPVVGSLKRVFERVPDGSSVLVDGERGEVFVNPRQADTERYQLKMRAYERAIVDATAIEREEDALLEECGVQLLANIGRPAEIRQVDAYKLSGVGLFRTEYLFLNTESPPSRADQRAVYAEVLRGLPGRPVTIRTLDLGGDKRPRFKLHGLDHDTGAALRGLRLSLAEDSLFRVQIQAILDAVGDNRDVGVLLPMVVSADDLARAVDQIHRIAEALHVSPPPIGAMIEVPSAVFEAEEILDLVDFAAIGTNDLVQFMLATERRTVDILGEEAVFQPAVLRAIARVVRLARERGKPLSVCGEAAGNPYVACLLVGLGVRRLSMSPVRATRLRGALRKQRLSDLESLASTALRLGSREKVATLARELCQ